MNEKDIQLKLKLIKLADKLNNVSQACEIVGYSRDSYYRFKKLYESGGIRALQEKTRKKANLKNRVKAETEKAVLDMTEKNPAFGQLKLSRLMQSKGIAISPTGVRSIWLRNNIETSAKRFNKFERKRINLTDVDS